MVKSSLLYNVFIYIHFGELASYQTLLFVLFTQNQKQKSFVTKALFSKVDWFEIQMKLPVQ